MKKPTFIILLLLVFLSLYGCKNQKTIDSKTENSEQLSDYNNNEEIVIDEETFPDDSFRKYVMCFYDKNNDGYLSQQEIFDVKEIFIADYNFEDADKICSIKGIEYFVCLEQCKIWDTSIDSIDLSYNRELKVFVFGNNNRMIRKIDLSNNLELEELACFGANLSEVDVSKLQKLKILDISGNAIEDLDVSNNHMLEKLDCSGTNISELDISKNTSLKKLLINSTNISHIDLDNNINLEFINCELTKIKILNIENNQNLKSIYCYDSNIKKIDLTNNTNVNEIICNEDTIIIGEEQVTNLYRMK